MYSAAYITGFMEKLAEYEKSAKFSYEMNSDEKKKDKILRNSYLKNIRDRILRNPEDRVQDSFLGELGRVTRKAGRKINSLGRGALSAAGVTGIRTLENAADLVTWLPAMTDKLIFGKMLGVDEGRGFLGRSLGKGHRLADKYVHRTRKWSEDYDYKNRIDSKFNRFIQGAPADALGSFLGFGGLGGFSAKGINRILGPLFGSTQAIASLGDGQYKQLRQRGKELREMNPLFAQYLDPTSTAYNQENAPTRAEYQKYYRPSYDLPSAVFGKLRVPRAMTMKEDNTPVQFRKFGE